MPRFIILTSAMVGIALCTSPYAGARSAASPMENGLPQGILGSQLPPPGSPAIVPNPNSPAMIPNAASPPPNPAPKAYYEEIQRQNFRSEEIRSNELALKLGPDSPDVRNLNQSVEEARRRMDAHMDRQSVNDALREVEKRRQQVEDKANGLR